VATGDAAPLGAVTVVSPAPAGQPRWLLPAAGALVASAVVVALLAVAGVFSGGDEPAPERAAFGKGAVTVTPIRIDGPAGVAIGAGDVWMTSYVGDQVARIDPGTGAVRRPISVGDGPGSIAVGEGAVWVVNGDAATVSKVDIARGEVVGNPIALPSTAPGDSIAVGDGRIWVVTPERGRVVPIEASTGKLGTAIAPPDGAAGELALGEGGLWVVGDHGTVTRIDPASGEAGEPVKVGKEVPEDDVFRGQIAVGEGAVWVAALDDETVVRLDPRSGEIVKTIRFKDGIEGDLAVGEGSVWVFNESGGLIRIDPRRNVVAGRPLPAGTAGTNQMAAGAGAIWIVGDEDQDTVSRVAL
jgi:streptogramin lyase